MADERHDLPDVSRFWDGLVRGERADPGRLDPETADTIRRLHGLASSPLPVSARERARERVLGRAGHTNEVSSTMDQESILRPDGSTILPNGLAGAMRRRTPYLPLRRRRDWLAVRFATALLLIVTLIAIWFSFRPHHHEAVGPGDGTPTAVPAPPPANVPTFLGGFARTGVNSGPGPRGVPAVRWSLEEGHPFWGAPAVVNGVVYSSGNGGALVALDAATGREIWRFDVPSFSDGSPTVVDGVVYAGFKDKKLRAFDAATGVVRWEFDAGEVIPATPAVIDGVVYVGTGIESSVGTLFAVGAADGRERWRLPLDAVAFVSPAVDGGIVYVATGTGGSGPGQTLYALDAATGTGTER